MAFDGIAVSVITRELNEQLKNMRIVKIYQVDQHTIIFHLRGLGETKQLLISTSPTYPRIHTTTASYENPPTPPAFCMLLRKYLEPSRILQITQHELERIIKIDLEAYDAHLGQSKKTLIFELMGRHSNLSLVDNDYIIIDAINRLSENNNVRPIFPGIKYTFPPNQGKVNPYQVSKEEFINSFRLLPANLKLYQGLMQLYQGLGSEAAQEAIRRAQQEPNQLKQDLNLAEFEQLWLGLQDLLNNPGLPSLVKDGKKMDFFAYSLTLNKEQDTYSNLDQLLDQFYTQRITKEQIQQKANNLKRVLNTHLKRILKKEQIQRKTLEVAAEGEKWQKYGELITANLHKINKGNSSIEVVDYYDPDQPLITIDLDPQLSPSENAQLFFKRYKKSKTSNKITGRQLEKTIAERIYLENVLLHIDIADSMATLEEIETELIEQSYLKTPKAKKESKKKQANSYDKYISSDGNEILVGRNNKQNDNLTFRVARPDELWLHVQKIPGSHVIIRSNTNKITDQTLLEAATLAAYYSKARNLSKVAVDYTERKHVRKPSGAKPGFVFYENFKTIIVDPTNPKNMPKKET